MRRLTLVLLGILFAGPGPAQAQNLVVNGGFESGAAGWTTWRAPWGSGEVWDFNDTDPEATGTRCLRLSTPGNASFGVYQQVAVTPGRTYRIDCRWKGTKFGESNWYEVLLLDGPFNQVFADSGSADLVQPNFMYAYDSGTFPLPGDFGWIWTHEQNGTPVDTHGRFGKRTATGNVMTIVLKAGACCGTNGASAWFDEVSLVEDTTGQQGCRIDNGSFTADLAGWTPWVVHDTGGDHAAIVDAGELTIGGSHSNGGVYQQFDVQPGTVVNIMGRWRSDPAPPPGMWAEVLVINGDRLPTDGVDEVDGVNGAILLFRNDTFDGRGAWNGPIGRNAPVKHQVSFVAASTTATLVLRTGNNGPGTPTSVTFDDLSVHCVPPAGTIAAPPAGFVTRSLTFPVGEMVSLAQSPVSRHIYAVRNNQFGGSSLLYRIDTGETFSATLAYDLSVAVSPGFSLAQGICFDSQGNVYISNFAGRIIRGVDTNPDPAVDAFVFSQILDLPDIQIGTFHGVGGVAVGPDNKLYINSGSGTHYGPEPDNGYNMRILRCELTGGIHTVETFAEGIRNSFDIVFRSDGKLFGIENGPLIDCDYAEEFNLIREGVHYGFPYKFSSDLSGSDASILCTSDGGNVGPQPGGPSDPAPGWANYGPDAKPGPGQRGYVDGGEYYGFDPHSSPDGLSFYEPALMDPQSIKFPSEYHGRAFVARFGMLENVPKVGFDVLSLRLDEPGEGFLCNRFLTNLGRCIDVLCAYNGRLYVLEFNSEMNGPGIGGGPSRLHEIAYTIQLDPQIGLSATSIHRQTAVGVNLPDDTFTVFNSGPGTISYTVSTETPWLSVAPDAGTSEGPSDETTFTITYNVAGLPVGTHAGAISIVDPNAINSPQTISVSVQVQTVKADLDADGDVDQSDFAILQKCFSGPGIAATLPCMSARMDGDSDVDGSDFELWLQCFSGPGIPAVATCDDAFE
jgi:hypothetical protein